MPEVHLEDPEWSRAVLGLLARTGQTRAPASALLLKADHIEVNFRDSVRAADAPFQTMSHTRWALARRSGTLAKLPSTPTLVTASRRAALVTAWNTEDARCLLDIVGCGSVALDGPPVAVGATLSDVVVELATHRWSDLDEIVVVGFGSEIAGLERVRCLPTADAAAKYLVESETGPAGHRARCLVVAPPLGKNAQRSLHPLRSLTELVEVLPDTGLICCDSSLSSIRTIWRISAHRETTELSFRQNDGVLVRLCPSEGIETSEKELRGWPDPSRTEQLDCPQRGGIGLCGGSSSSSAHIERPPRRASPGAEVTVMPVLVRILGPVDVTGTSTPLDRRPRVTELVVYLALHRDGCSGEALAAAVWPDRRVPAQTVANRLTEARQALGEAAAGRPRLRRVSGRHVLTSDVDTDWAEFERLTEPGSGPEQWSGALGLIRGRPFEGLTDSGWTLLEGFVASIEGRIIDISCRLASRCLDIGDATHAEWAVRRGLMASPWDERLYRMLMIVNHAAGNRGGMESALRSLAHMLDWQGDPLDG
ncbi:MAG: AfsR/SARP family transcriptional regulator, partial [Acidimicrobiales bacterium]